MTQIQYTCDTTTFNIVMPDHHQAHEWKNGQPGNDSISVYPRMLNSLRTTVYNGVIVRVSQHYYVKDGKIVFFPGGQLNLTDYIPVESYYCRLIVIGLDTTTNELAILSGTESLNTTVTLPQIPENIPTSWILSSVIKLMAGTTVLTDLEITDAKEYLNRYDGGSNVWPKPGKCNVASTEYSSLANALASSGTLIRMGEGTFLEGTPIESRTLVGSGITNTIISQENNPVIEVNECQLENLSVVTAYVTMDIVTAIIAISSELRNVYAEAITTASHSAFAFYLDGSTLHHCKAFASDGGLGGTKLSVFASSGFNSLIGGQYDGDIVVSEGATLYLDYPILENCTFTVYGECFGWYYDSTGGLHSYGTGGTDQVLQQSTLNGAISVAALTAGQVGAPGIVASSVEDNLVAFADSSGAQKDSGYSAASFAALDYGKVSKISASDGSPDPAWSANATGNLLGSAGLDVYPDGDAYGLWDRIVNWGFTPDEHWPQGADELVWSGWANYVGFTTPSSIAISNSMYRAANNAAALAFRYRAASTGAAIALRARVGITYIVSAGLMIDDGTDKADGKGANNFVRCYLRQAAIGAPVYAEQQARDGGGAVVTTTSTFTLPPHLLAGLQLLTGGTRWTNWTCASSIFGEGKNYIQFTTGSGAHTWTPARVGLFAVFTAGDGARKAIWDWYDEATS